MVRPHLMPKEDYLKLLEQQWGFKNLPPIGQAELDAHFPAAVAEFEREYKGKDFPFCLAGQEFMPTSPVLESTDPNNTNSLIARFPRFDPSSMDLDALVDKHHSAVAGWQEFDIEGRLRVAERAQQLLRENFWLLSAVQVFEAGRSISQSANIVNEAVDFSEWNSLMAKLMYFQPLAPSLKSAGDYSYRDFVPLGVIMGSDPFNFQDAIAWDMMHRSLITGNTYIQKSSEWTPLTGYLVFRMWDQAIKEVYGSNEGILSFIAGGGSQVTPALLSNPKVVGHCFTGSADVIGRIDREYGGIERINGARLVHPCAEASGVDALYVHRDANLDTAVEAIVKSAFPLSGQKCSALSVLIADADIYDELMTRVEKATDELKYGHPMNGAYLGAVISDRAKTTIEQSIKNATRFKGVKVAYQKQANVDTSLPGHHVVPTILEVDYDIFKQNPHYQENLRELRDLEIFGPVFVAFKVRDLEEAAEVNNSTSFKLTGGVITSSRGVLEEVRRKFKGAGRFYVNRQITASYMGTAGFGPLLSRSGTGMCVAGTPTCLAHFVSDYAEVGFTPKNP